MSKNDHVPGSSLPKTVMPLPAPGDTKLVVEFPIVVIGSSAGGLEACRALFDGWHDSQGMAFIIVQHLDPTHESMLVPLLASHTALHVHEAQEGAGVVPGVVHVIAPGKYLKVEDMALRLTDPAPGTGVRLPLDALLMSLANSGVADRCACIILSGTGADGSAGATTLKEGGGLIIAQDPEEAQFDAMPRNAILTGSVDHILPIKDIPSEVKAHFAATPVAQARIDGQASQPAEDIRPILDWLHLKTHHDFRLYKTGTLTRRIKRRMQMFPAISGMAAYLDRLKKDDAETEMLAQDLMINVTAFFRDPEVFDYLEKHVIPELLSMIRDGKPLRVWVAGCSTGEEAYSLAMLLLEACTAPVQQANIQIFASDADGDAIDFARAGLYPLSISDQIPGKRLERFFVASKEGYQASQELRGLIVFTAHDVLTDPPFARLDFISCRNLLIYLGPEAQRRLLGLFHFALAPDGLLLLGTAETAGGNNSIFIPVNKPIAGIFMAKDTKPLTAPPPEEKRLEETGLDYGAICRQLVLEQMIPAAVLINQKNEWLFAMGPTERFLRPASGYPTRDLPDLIKSSLRGDLVRAILEARSTQKKAIRTCREGFETAEDCAVIITALPLGKPHAGLLLVGLGEEQLRQGAETGAAPDSNPDGIEGLKRDLAAARSDLASVIHALENANEEQGAINAEAASVNEEYQSANEELLTSKEELQSLNEELTALNSQLQETLELHRTTSNDLQNVLYSTNVATIFLDRELRIRFFTPATKSLFNVIASDIGRPLSDLASMASDSSLLDDARLVLSTGQARDREIGVQASQWFLRRIVPYLAQDGATEGVVITFVDVTERHLVADDLGAAKRAAETATIAKSRFLAAASHDLRQPLQTLSLLQGLLSTMVEGGKAEKLVERFGTTLASMSGMLSTLLDINQIEAGTVRAAPVRFNINELFGRLKDEFTTHASAQGLSLKVVPCSLELYTDPRLLEQMLRNLLSNALKYTKRGKILLGCRRRPGHMSIEIWDTGIGIPESELKVIFQEYHQLDNPARERGRGLGLGLAIVQSLVNLLGYKVRVRSALGKGSVFVIEIGLPGDQDAIVEPPVVSPVVVASAMPVAKDQRILIVEDDPDVRELLDLFLLDEGFQTLSARDGETALEHMHSAGFVPDLILADFNLPNAFNGAELTVTVRERLAMPIPAIILTGDISTRTARGIKLEGCIQLNKPVKLDQLRQSIDQLLSSSGKGLSAKPALSIKPDGRFVFVVDDDEMIRASLRDMLEQNGFCVEDYATSEDFLDVDHNGADACLLVDAYLPGMDGLQLIETLNRRNQKVPSIMITGHSDVAMAVAAMKAGATDFFEKPISAPALLASIERVFERSKDAGKADAWHQAAMDHVAGLTLRQREIMDLVLAGHPNKNIAADLGISQRTVENHRAAVMRKTGSKSLPALARLALAAGGPTFK